MFLAIEVYENFFFTFFSIFNVRFVSLFVQINYDMIKDRTNIYWKSKKYTKKNTKILL